jgi:hypothetical protein
MLRATPTQPRASSGRHRQALPLMLAAIAGLLPPAMAAGRTEIPMAAAQWQASGEVAFARDDAGRDMLVVRQGYAELLRHGFSNGTIEFDAKFVGSRITGITFRHHGDTADALYFRPNPRCAVADDCIQYMPTAHHLFEWDLYGQYQARAPIDPATWNHVRLVVSGGRMNVFVNGPRVPTLAVDRLVGGYADGAIRLHGPASYAHLTIAPGATDGLSPTPATDPTRNDPRYLRHWRASAPFPMPSRMDAGLRENTGIDPVYAGMPARSATWTPVAPDPGGLVNLTRWYGAAQTGPAITGIWLKTTVVSDREQVRHVDMGWTREAWVFVNGKPVFAGKNLYGVPGASRPPDGRLALANGSFELPLHKGVNEVAVALDDNFGGGEQHFGWGLVMRMGPAGVNPAPSKRQRGGISRQGSPGRS